jgi:hypothetical protein
MVTILSALVKSQSIPYKTIIEVTGFTNPMESSFSNSFEIRTFTTDMFLIDQIDSGLGVT